MQAKYSCHRQRDRLYDDRVRGADFFVLGPSVTFPAGHFFLNALLASGVRDRYSYLL